MVLLLHRFAPRRMNLNEERGTWTISRRKFVCGITKSVGMNYGGWVVVVEDSHGCDVELKGRGNKLSKRNAYVISGGQGFFQMWTKKLILGCESYFTQQTGDSCNLDWLEERQFGEAERRGKANIANVPPNIHPENIIRPWRSLQVGGAIFKQLNVAGA